MGQPAKVSVEVRDFQGLLDNQDPHDPETGAGERQVNLAVIRQGELQVRLGYRVLKFVTQNF